MLEELPKEVREGLEAARKLARRRGKTRLRLHVGDAVYPILRVWDDGFALDAETTPHLRGLVDVHESGHHILQCLIVASREDNGEIICDFKRNSTVSDRPALDFARTEDAPAALLPRY